MVILISSAKNGRNKTENVSTVFLSLAPRVHYSECSLIHTLSASITRKIIEIQYICRPDCEEFISQPRFIAMRLSPQDLVRDRSSRCNHDRARQSSEICITIKSRLLMDAITICVNANFQKGTPLCIWLIYLHRSIRAIVWKSFITIQSRINKWIKTPK